MLMAISMMVTGKTTRRMVLVSIHTQMGPNMKAIGLMINSTAKERSIGQMVHNMRVNISSERKMVMANFCGQIAQATVVSSSTIIFMGRALILGPMVEFTTAIGNKIKCTEKELSLIHI